MKSGTKYSGPMCQKRPFGTLHWNRRQPLISAVLNDLCSIVPITTIKNDSKEKGYILHENTRIRAYRNFWILGTHGGIHEREIYRAKID